MFIKKNIALMTWLNSILNGTTTTKFEHKIHSFVKRFLGYVVVINLITVILSSFVQFSAFKTLFLIISYFSTLIFVIEYCLRFYSAPVKRSNVHRIRARIQYAVSFMGIIDFITIIPFIIQHVHAIPPDYEILSEISKIFLVLKLARYSNTFKFILDVFLSVKAELAFAITAAISIILFSGVLMYYVEREAQPEVFYNVGQGMWWSVITFTTVGYGDISPITAMGKILAGLIAMVGIGMLALPAGIISSTFFRKINEIKESNSKANEENSKIEETNPTNDERQNYCPHCGAKLNKDGNH